MTEVKDVLQGKWFEMKGHVKEQWGKLTDDDIMQMHGRREELVGALQKRYGYDRAKAEREINAWLQKYP